VTALLALGSAIAFGAGDFCGGLASRRAPALKVTALAQIASAIALLPMLLLVAAPVVTSADVVWGAVGGVFGVIGLLLLFTALGEGPMGIVAPTTSVVSALVPLAWGLASGERPGGLAYLGMALGLAAIAAVTMTDGPAGRLNRSILTKVLAAGLGFAFFFIALSETSVESGLWPLVGSRAVSVPIILLLVWRRAHADRLGAGGHLAVVSGILDMVANALFLSAAQRGLLTIAAVLSALYPAVTAVLAGIVLRERMTRLQVGGVAAALGAVVLIGLSS
jgi:uncharacterized membrane protein